MPWWTFFLKLQILTMEQWFTGFPYKGLQQVQLLPLPSSGLCVLPPPTSLHCQAWVLQTQFTAAHQTDRCPGTVLNWKASAQQREQAAEWRESFRNRRRSLPGVHGQRLISGIYRNPKSLTQDWRRSFVTECLPSMVEVLGLKNPAQRRLTSFAKRINNLYYCHINFSCQCSITQGHLWRRTLNWRTGSTRRFCGHVSEACPVW